MTEEIWTKSKRPIRQEACEWFIKLSDDRLRKRDRYRSVRWMKESPEHVAELLRLQLIHRMLRSAQLERHSPPVVKATDTANVVELFPAAAEPRARHPPSPRRSLLATISAVVLIASAVAGLWTVAFLDRTITTDLGEWRGITLSDQTKVMMGPRSKLRVSFGDQMRAVDLIQGEAQFRVSEDAARPFIVRSDLLLAVAIGTEFRVSRERGTDVVAVTEGTVRIYDNHALPEVGQGLSSDETSKRAPDALTLDPGEQAFVPKLGRTTKSTINLEHERARGDGWLTFEATTLGAVVEELNRRNHVQIVLEDSSVATRPLAFLRVRATDPESFIAALAADRDIFIGRTASRRYYVRTASAFNLPQDAVMDRRSPDSRSPD